MEKRTAIVLGLGEIGQPIYKMLAKAYGTEEVRGWDSDKSLMGVSLSADLGILRAMKNQTFTFMHVCYPQLPGFVDSVWEYKDLYEPSYIIVHSTVSPGILGKVQQTVGVDTKVYYSPVRGNQRDGMEECLHSYTKYLASVMPYASESKAGSHLEEAGFTVKHVHGLDGLVWAKLLDLAWYGLNIAFYQEVERIVPDILDYEIVKEFISSTPQESDGKARREVFYGGFIGGHCVTQAIEKILAERDTPMLRAVLDSNIKRFVELAHKKPYHHP